MRLLWAILYLGNALAASIPHADSHQLRLPFVPSPDDLANGVISKLSLNFSIQNGYLYANEHQVYPPSVKMQLHAPLYEGVNLNKLSTRSVDLSYTLETQQLSKDDTGSTADMIRVRIELLSLQGNLVSPHAVAINLLVHKSGQYEMDRLRIEPARSGDQEDHFSQNSQPWVIRYWNTQFGSAFDNPKAETMMPAQGLAPVKKYYPQIVATNAEPSDTAVEPQSKGPFWAEQARFNRHLYHDYHPKDSPTRTIPLIVLPVLLVIVIGLVVCLIGFPAANLLMFLGVCLGGQKVQSHRSPSVSMEEGTFYETVLMIPQICVTDASDSKV
ncbi:uncharacterized protein N7479_001493 [Penicillium vulpinum]|uniref:DUF7728 domain-containing protein n=1 Tax=Penicillium vulpinum TaxID=29845 RepID=A0A1V6RV38_9EURO|nr:uncharacterized protein N7479_001493 [Penicillium vulpinum]KAJ5971575.1 hypothetical protein N7479_001493 [Penicillium vulpinum]OQE05448.1 hypothetical protein PENVUL_c024G07163 [Penicillium vulpinum]